jgi:Fe-S-cluster formation regulator IscX/YfhJ
VGKSKLEFFAKITTSDGREIMKRVEEDIPDEVNLDNLDEFLSTFDDYERHALKARNGICEEITQAWLDEQAKKGV